MKKFEFRIVDYGYFAESVHDMELYRGLNHMCNAGWKIVKIFEPMQYKNSSEYFSRVIFKKKLKLLEPTSLV